MLSKRLTLAAVLVIITSTMPASASDTLAPTGTLRAVYLASNPAQAVRDPKTGEPRGASIDLTRELGRRLGVPVTLAPSPTPLTVIEAVAKGEADIGYVAYDPSRAGTVEFSQTYMLVGQTFIVPENSRIRAIADIDQSGLRIGAGKGDSIALRLGRTLKQSTLVETDNSPAQAKEWLTAGKIDAFGANRQRLTTFLAEMPGYRLLPDNLFGVTQTIAIPKGKPEALATLNRFIDDVRASGFLQDAITRSGVIGVDVAPAGSDRR